MSNRKVSTDASTPRPLWRWWLWCVLNNLYIGTDWEWVRRAWQWAIVPAWLGDGGADCGEEEPF